MYDLHQYIEILEKKKTSFNLLIKSMSLRKDKSSEKNKAFMRLALELANQNKGLTGLNPSVGCVVTHKDEIISYGKTDINGRPHAEVVALKNNKINFKNSNM